MRMTEPPSPTPARLSRRRCLAALAAAAGLRPGEAAGDGLVEGIEASILRRGREGGPSWFHPRACVLPGSPPRVFMTLQTIGGSDYFGPVHWMESPDAGRTWSEPRPVPALGRTTLPDGSEEGACDVVPEYHPRTGSVLALGHNVFYRDGALIRPQPRRRPVYAVRRGEAWSERRALEWDDPRGAYIYTNNCGQRVNLDNGDVLLVLSFGARETSRSAASALCSFDGERLAIRRVGPEIRHAAGRGLLEPSVVRYRERFYLTLRAEDGRGYVAAADDGLEWTEKQPWAWEDGTPLEMSTTQQHWLAHPRGLFLVYTRKDASNAGVTRWRAPLYMARVEPARLRLIRASERVLLPLDREGAADPARAALMGNFHPVLLNEREAWVTVGENRPRHGYRGDLLLARIRWRGPGEKRE